MIWAKHPDNPIIGPGITRTFTFDCSIVPVGNLLRMWFSWRDLRSIAYCESTDGVHWSCPRAVLEPEAANLWEKEDVNRPSVLKVGDTWYMWYTAQNFADQISGFGLATSPDGLTWSRVSRDPVFEATGGWEKKHVMCPYVLHENGRFRMWYSAGEMYEADATGYAESDDGIHWRRHSDNPVIYPLGGWEADRTIGVCIVPRQQDYLAFYIGFEHGFEDAQIGLARSPDGIHNWERYPGNPIIRRGPAGSWDDCNVYRPTVLYWKGLWHLWYNAARRSDRREQIGLATTEHIDF